MRSKLLILGLILVFLSISAVSASENITDNVLVDDSWGYNANINIKAFDKIDNYVDMNVEVCNGDAESIADAKLYLNNQTANSIDEKNYYHFIINYNGEYNLTLDDGIYKAVPISLKINFLSNPPESIIPKDIPDEGVEDVKKINLVSKNVTIYYDDMEAELIVKALDENGNHVRGLNILMDNQLKADYDKKDGYRFYLDYLSAGNHVVEISLDDEKYAAEPIQVYVEVLKSRPTVTAKKWYSTPGQYVTLKAEVKDKDDIYWIDEGTVTFNINGKSYKVKVEGGEAVKKVKISKAGTYTYTATFKSENHYTKKVSQKVYVYSTSKKSRTFEIKGYKVTLSVNQFKKLVNAKNTNKIVGFEVKTNKYFKQKVGNYKTTTKWKYVGETTPETAHERGWKCENYVKHWISDGEYYYTCDAYKKVTTTKMVYKTVNARVSLVISYGGKNGGQTAPANKYHVYLNTPYQNPGYEKCTPTLSGSKTSSEINKLNSAKTRSY